ncbi:UDP-N-acetylglucosamine 4,6-dehydratase (inverting) [Candidatus Poribacteria bacterium]|nr:UDP-N-acetylglucosamine 4,6-dehydratase (inverting) [Candidatus Poribacteria bacterium]
MCLHDQTVLVTGGTGSFGKKFVQLALEDCHPKKIIIFSRDEFKQHEMRTSGFDQDCLRYFLGDVRDKDRLRRALDGVDIVIHAAALKHVPACEYNPIEAVKTNVIGAANLIEAAIDRGVKKVLALSTDKAAAPVNLYGATKLCSDKLLVAGNSYSGLHITRFSVVRYGNVLGSRGSVVPLFQKLSATGSLPVTDPAMTRFWLTLDQGVRFVLHCLDFMEGGETFVPKIPSMSIMDLAKAIGPECDIKIVGIRPGEKIHEVLIPEDDARNTVEFADKFVILPQFRPHVARTYLSSNGGKLCPEGFRYSSDNNSQWLSVEEMRSLLDAYKQEGTPSDV